MEFEEKLLKLRKTAGLTQEELAEKLNVSRQAVARWEAGETTPDMTSLSAICETFRVSADYLLGEIKVPASCDVSIRSTETAPGGGEIFRIPNHYGDETCSACTVVGNFIFLAHHAGGHEVEDIVYQTRATLEAMAETLAKVGATLDDMVQVNYYIKNVADFRKGADVFTEYFKNGAPARMTVVTEFISSGCLCQIDGIAYKPKTSK